MKAQRTEHTDRVFKLPGGTDENDLWTYVHDVKDGLPIISSVWVPTEEERLRIAAGENIRLNVWGNGHPPVAIDLTDEAVMEVEGAG